jgi:hypothetical protein
LKKRKCHQVVLTSIHNNHSDGIRGTEDKDDTSSEKASQTYVDDYDPFVDGFARCVAQVSDLLLCGTLDSDYPIVPEEKMEFKKDHGYGVVTSGQKYVFFKVQVSVEDEVNHRTLVPLGSYSLRCLSDNLSPIYYQSGDPQVLLFHQYVKLICALIVCLTEGLNSDERVAMMQAGALKSNAVALTAKERLTPMLQVAAVT